MNPARAKGRPKHAPQRTCVGCGSAAAKRELVRLVRTSSGTVELDLTGKRPARGAYLCHTLECWERALKKGRLESALRTRLSADDREALLRYGVEQVALEVR
jgi:predicted RNA-binding protein YlxR (DUF448 family)